MLLRVLEGRVAYLTLGALLSLADDDGDGDGDGDGENSRGMGGWMSMRQRRRRRQFPIVPPRNPPVPGSDGRIPSPSEARSTEVHIGVTPNLSGHGIGGGRGG